MTAAKDLQPLKDWTVDQLIEELPKYKAAFDYMVSPPDHVSQKERKKLFEGMVRAIFNPKLNPAMHHHLDIVHELWLRGVIIVPHSPNYEP